MKDLKLLHNENMEERLQSENFELNRKNKLLVFFFKLKVCYIRILILMDHESYRTDLS